MKIWNLVPSFYIEQFASFVCHLIVNEKPLDVEQNEQFEDVALVRFLKAFYRLLVD